MGQYIFLGDMPDARPEVMELGRRFVKACNLALDFAQDSSIEPLSVVAVLPDRLQELTRNMESVVDWLAILDGGTEDKFPSVLHLGMIFHQINTQLTMSLMQLGLGPDDRMVHKTDEMGNVISQTFTSIVARYAEKVGYSIKQGLVEPEVPNVAQIFDPDQSADGEHERWPEDGDRKGP